MATVVERKKHEYFLFSVFGSFSFLHVFFLRHVLRQHPRSQSVFPKEKKLFFVKENNLQNQDLFSNIHQLGNIHKAEIF